jgi:hypothetical protein
MPFTAHGGKPPSPSDFTPLFGLPAARHAQADLIQLAKLMILPKVRTTRRTVLTTKKIHTRRPDIPI